MNKYHATFFGQHHIAGQNGCAPNAYRYIDACQHHLLYIGRVIAFYPTVEALYVFQTFNVTHRAIEYNAGMRMSIDGIAQVITDQCAVNNFLIAVGNIYIAVLQYIYR